MATTVQTAVETLYGSSDFAVFFDDTLMNDVVIDFSTNGYVNGVASSATINCIYSESLYKIKNYDNNGNLMEEMHGIDYMTNVKIFIKNVVNNLYHMVFDGNLVGKSLEKSNEGNVSLSFAAEDYMHYLDKTVVPIAIPADAWFRSSDRVKWKAQGINIETVPKFASEQSRTLKNKNIKELIDECIDRSIANNHFFSDKEGVTYWDAPTDRLKVMGDVSEKLRKAEIIDYIVTSDGTSVSSMYVMIGSIANSLMFEFFQDRDGIIRVKPPFWNEGVLRDHIIMPSFVHSYNETTDFTKMYTRVVTQGSIDPSLNTSTSMKNYLLPVGCYVAGDENQQGLWVSYTSQIDPYSGVDRVKKAIDDFTSSNPNMVAGSVFGTPAIPAGSGSHSWNSATESFRPMVTRIAANWGMSPVVSIILAMIMQESSGGTGSSGSGIPADIDVMQANEGAYGEIHSNNKIRTPEDSINAGIQEFRDALTKAYGDVAVALQTYNFGPRYINYVKENGGVHTTSLAYAFSSMMAQKFPDDFPNGYGDPTYVTNVMRYVPVGSPTNYMPSTGESSGSSGSDYLGGILDITPMINTALNYSYINSVIFYNTMQRNTDMAQRQYFSLPNFSASVAGGLLGRQNMFTTGNASFNPDLWSGDGDIIDLIKSTQVNYTAAGGSISAGNNGAGAVADGRCIGSGSVTGNLYNIGRENLAKRQWQGIRATSGSYIDCRKYSTAHLLAVGRQYFGIPYKIVGERGSPSAGYDCASYVASVYSHFGIRIGTYVRAIDSPAHGELGGLDVKPVAFESLAVGDLLIWPDHTHVTMYAGNGRMYAAPSPGKVVEEQEMTKEVFNKRRIMAIRRPAIFSDSPGAGSYSNVGSTGPTPAEPVIVDPGTLLPGTVFTPDMLSNTKEILEQNKDLIAGRTAIEGVAPNYDFTAGSSLLADGTVKKTTAGDLPTGSPYSKSRVIASNNIDTEENSLLSQSNSERRYGANILNVDQPLIRGFDKFKQIMTEDGPAGSISDALRSYSIFMHGLTNGLIETATLRTTAPMPWLRCGMNCWIDPMGIDKIFYINGIRHMGSAKAGVHTEISLGYGRSRYQYLNKVEEFGSLRDHFKNTWRDNVFVSKIYKGYSINAFGDVLDKKEFEDTRKAIERNYEIGGGLAGAALSEPKSIDNMPFYRELYGGLSVDDSGRDDFGISVFDPKGEILVRTEDGTIITGTEFLKRSEGESSNSTPTDSGGSDGGSSSGSNVSSWIDGTSYPQGATHEDKKCLQYLGWLETMPSLRFGSSGEQVKRLQRIFYYLGIVIMHLNEIDGIFGAKTRKGVMTLQGTFDISKTGVLTSKEVSKLKQLLRNLLSSSSKSAYDGAVDGTPSTSTSSSGQPVLPTLDTPDSPLTGPVYYKSGDLYDYSHGKSGRGTKRMLIGAYSLKVIEDNLTKNYDQGHKVIRNRRDNVRKTFKRAMNEIATRSPMMKYKPN